MTKNRAQQLKQCLGSLAAQTTSFAELVIIDNASTDSTPQVIENFKKNVSFPVRLIKESGDFYPTIYNRGLIEARNTWVAFIDDDCVADLSWVESIQAGIEANPEVVCYLGNSKTYFDRNPYSVATWILNDYWQFEGRYEKDGVRNEIVDFTTLDNKNIVYNKEFFQKNKIKFDEQRKKLRGAAEDADLGLQIKKEGGRAQYLPEMLVLHKDPLNWQDFWKKITFSQQAFNTLQNKWASNLLNNRPQESLSLKNKYKRYLNHLKIPLFKKIYIILLIYLAGFITNNFSKNETS